MIFIYTIKEITEKTGLSAHTLRFYEKEGLLNPNRDKNGRRQYDDQNLIWIMFICKMRNSHMSINKIKAYKEFYLQGDETVQMRSELLNEHLSSIQNEIENLKRIEEFLVEKIKTYNTKYNTVILKS